MAAEPTAPAPPPNLRRSNPDDKGGECETCTYYQHGHCTAYPPLVVDGEWLCDHFKPSGRPDPDDQKQPRTMKEARTAARGLFKAARSQQ